MPLSERRLIRFLCAGALASTAASFALPAAAQIPSQAHKLLPADEAAQDPSFFTFRSQLIQALQRQDTAYLYSVLADDIKNTFGGDDGVAGFKRVWRLENPDSVSQSFVWETLLRVLTLGGRLRGDVFQAPYVSAFWPEAIDPFEFVAIVGDRVTVRVAPEPNATIVGLLSFDIVSFREWKDSPPTARTTLHSWAHVELGDGRAGWVHARFAHSPIGWRAFFIKRSGRWVLAQFAAGD